MQRNFISFTTRLAALGTLGAVSLAAVALASGPTTVTSKDGKTAVEAPYTKVDSTPERTKVRVEAPHTSVKVDTEARHVRIRVPYYNGDIRW